MRQIDSCAYGDGKLILRRGKYVVLYRRPEQKNLIVQTFRQRGYRIDVVEEARKKWQT